mgnify:FL=1
MEEKVNSEKLMQTYLYTQRGNFFVSTIYRRSSAMLNPDGWYYETFAWKLIKNTNERGEWVADNSGAFTIEGAIKQHNKVCSQLIIK